MYIHPYPVTFLAFSKNLIALTKYVAAVIHGRMNAVSGGSGAEKAPSASSRQLADQDVFSGGHLKREIEKIKT